jgi:class 3 adenylate cyclase
MGISFRTRVFLYLIGTVLAVLAGAVLAIDRAYAARVEVLVRTRIAQERSNFRQATTRLRDALIHDCFLLASSARIQASLEEERLHAEVGGVALYEMQYHMMQGAFLAFLGTDGRSIARYLAGADGALERRPPAEAVPEEALWQRLMDGAAPEELEPFLIDGERLFQVAALPIFDRDRFRGVVVLGHEITDSSAESLHELQASNDGMAYVAGQRLAASSFRGEQRRAAAEAIAGCLQALEPGSSSSFEATLLGEPYQVVLTALAGAAGERRLGMALYLSLKSLRDFRSEMQRLTLLVALAASAASLLLANRIALSVSQPVHSLLEGTQRIARGEYSHRIAVRSKDELGELAGAFNQMASGLAHRERVRAVLNKVVAHDVAERLIEGELGLGGRLTEASLLFADLRGFTPMTEGMAPQAVVAMLNELMTAMSREVLAAGGIVDKYVGDQIIGLFGVPEARGNHARSALDAALGMRARLERLNAERARRGEPPLAMGVGVHTGEVVAGCMGSEEHLSYTCIGAAMNLAARLCSSAEAGQILASDAAVRAAGGRVRARRLEPIAVKGFSEPVAVHEVLEAAGAEAERLVGTERGKRP